MNRIPKGDVRIELYREELSCKGAGFRYTALWRLHDLLGADEVPILKTILRSEPEAYVRRLSAQLLGLHGDPGTLDVLLQAYRDPDPTVQVTAAASLNRLGQPGPAEEIFPRLAPSLRDPDGAVRREAVGDICRLGLLSSAPLILQSFRDSNGDVRFAAARGVVDLDPPGLRSTLDELRKDPDPNVVEAADFAIKMYERAHKPK
jgi:HEAT repeat protein